MHLDSVRELKAGLMKSVIRELSSQRSIRLRALAAQPVSAAADSNHRTISLGVAQRSGKDFGLAVRVQWPELMNSAPLDLIRRQAREEVDVRYIGRVVKRVARTTRPWFQKRCRPLRIGCSIGHYRITAGTLGCFVTGRGNRSVFILSNNHVLADEDRAKAGDAILQTGLLDGGKQPGDSIAKLKDFVKLNRFAANSVDAAVASLGRSTKYDPGRLTDELGVLAGPAEGVFPDEGSPVYKIGRTTGMTRGKVTAFDMDNVTVCYDSGEMKFDGQVEIQGDGTGAFSAGGDSGALIVDADRKAIALLFAGSEQGGADNLGVTYANPLRTVLDALKVDLLY